ncbi:glycosyltransferase [Anaerocolumna xylanovorans]|uniref:Glycosyltransferase involved in cell wall bisynthesis n=1 Tax=Anaerocolumna xylanovorans DSM 12503 TaxID=1121345 RepID=A0A1M7Y844_9FIRM|nr:glycosyltransferase [Anaerocolumna xylanovorans]SHO48790.1 Glycosyltransferase involved in cell wall bisynthesis [Anaerocolumna xylanovorans DSM 12503]
MIKILHKMPNNDIHGGIQAFVANYARYMDRNKFKNDILVSCKEYYESEWNDSDIKYIEKTSDKGTLKKSLTKILEQDYDVFHLHTSYWMGYEMESIAMELGIKKVIVHSHGSSIYVNSDILKSKKLELHNEYKNRFTVNDATHFCACSQKAADWLYGTQIPKERIRIIKNAINIDKFSFNIEARNIMRKRLNFDGCFVIGNSGRFSAIKNHSFMIELFNKIFKENRNARLLLVGEGIEKDNIRYKIKKYGLENIVSIIDWTDKVELYLNAMDLFIMPSFFEGLGMAVIEAQSTGLKCLASDTVPEETEITENIKRLPLDLEMWYEETKKIMGGYNRKSALGQIRHAGYDIKEQVKIMEKLYSE